MKKCTSSLALVLFVALSLANAEENATDDNSCYAQETEPYVFFSTKTSYLEVDNEDVAQIGLPGK